MELVDLRSDPTEYPMRSPFLTAMRRSTTADNVTVRALLAGGVTGYGEGSPADYVTGETPQSVLRDCRVAAEALAGVDVRRTAHWSARLREALPSSPTARCAVEMALFDALCRAHDTPMWVWFGGAGREVRTDLTLPISETEQAAEEARKAAALGYRSLKIKVGGADREADFERVLAVSRAAPGVRLRLDANQAFTAAETLELLRRCQAEEVPVEMVEQPVPREDLEALAEVTRWSPVPVIADEAVLDAAAAVRIASLGAAHGVNIKLAKAGMFGALQIISVARAAGLKLMIGCMLESLLGSAAAVHLACGTGVFDFLDIDSHALIGLEPPGVPFAQQGDVQRVPEAVPGHGWEPHLLPG